ncbi:MAG: hypothetical protein ABJN69_07890 [Hellea sp.]
MAQNTISKRFTLNSGAECHLLNIRNDMIPNYYLMCFPREAGEPSDIDVAQMLTLGVDYARQIAFDTLGDKEAFSVLYSGYSARREKGWHVHIVLLGNRWRKAWLYSVLALKNLLQAFGIRKDDAPKLKT